MMLSQENWWSHKESGPASLLPHCWSRQVTHRSIPARRRTRRGCPQQIQGCARLSTTGFKIGVTDTMVLKWYYVFNHCHQFECLQLNKTLQILPGCEQSAFVPHFNYICCLWGQNFSSEVTEFLPKAEIFHLFPMKILKICLPFHIDTQLISN